MKIASKAYAALVFIFLYAPIIVMIVFSFNSSSSTSVFSGFSLQWYKVLLEDEATLRALYNTLILAVSSSVIATVLGTAAAVGIDKFKKVENRLEVTRNKGGGNRELFSSGYRFSF